MFRKPIRKFGKGFGIYIERSLVEDLEITPETDLEMVTDGNALILSVSDPKKRFLQGRTKRFHKMGHGFSLSLDTSILEVLGIPLDAMMEQTSDGETTIMLRYVEPNRQLRSTTIEKARARIEAHTKKLLEKAAKEQQREVA